MKYHLLTLFIFFSTQNLTGQEEEQSPPPAYQTERAKENYEYLKNEDYNPYKKGLLDEIKLIPLNNSKSVYLTLGGEYRPRLEIYTNRNWTDQDETFYSQRLNFHTSFNLGKHVRLFGELYHGYTSNERQITQDDAIDLHQGFIEIKIGPNEPNTVYLKLGRQEMGLGAGRLVDLRDGPNVRRSFDMGKVTYKKDALSIHAFYGKEVNAAFSAFDNDFSLFNESANNSILWGAYSELSFNQKRNLEFYYLGFQTQFSAYSNVGGKEVRHSTGIRSFGTIGKKWKYNTELIYQFGTLGEVNINAFNFEADWQFLFPKMKWAPALGLKLDWSSGDKTADDGKLQTFNPMFVNPAIYSLAGLNTPANLLSVHPSITVYPSRNLMLNLEYALLFRSSIEDGLYDPPRFQTRMANGIEDSHLGDVIGLLIFYSYNRNLSFNIRGSYFIAGAFLEASGDAESTFQIAPTANFKF